MDNRLLQATGGAAPVVLTYDPMGRLSSYAVNGGTATTFLYDGVNLVAEYAGLGSTPIRRYLHGLGTDQPFIQFNSGAVGTTDANWLYANYQGSVMAIADGVGVGSVLLRYDPYGMPVNSSGTRDSGWTGSRFGYTGQTFLSEAKLCYYKARVYDPKYGRFLQTDPIGSLDNLDRYQYASDDPVDGSDPTGNQVMPQEIFPNPATLPDDQTNYSPQVQNVAVAIVGVVSCSSHVSRDLV